MPSFLFRLWAHEAEDGLLAEIIITAPEKMPAAALALQHFVWMGRPMSPDSYLESEPDDGRYLRVRDVLTWVQSAEGRMFAREWALHLDPIGSEG